MQPQQQKHLNLGTYALAPLAPPELVHYKQDYKKYYEHYQVYWQWHQRHGLTDNSCVCGHVCGHEHPVSARSYVEHVIDRTTTFPGAVKTSVGQDQVKNTTPPPPTPATEKETYAHVTKERPVSQVTLVAPPTECFDIPVVRAPTPPAKAVLPRRDTTRSGDKRPTGRELRIMYAKGKEGMIETDDTPVNLADVVVTCRNFVAEPVLLELARQDRLPKTNLALFNFTQMVRRIRDKKARQLDSVTDLD